MKKTIVVASILIVAGAAGLFLLLQLVPYGHNHINPPILKEPQWDSLQTRQLVQRACFDCHSNETVWPWYSNIAPVSWLVQSDVEEGRSRLDFSEWSRGRVEVGNIAALVKENEMPPAKYLMIHPSANLSSEEKQALLNGILATFGGSSSGQ